MKRVFLFAALVLCCASLALAQNASSQSQDQTASPTANAPASSGTLQGCLSESQGNYMLTEDSTGAIYKLMGSDDKLQAHVGHEVLVTGQVVNAGSSSSASGEDPGSRSGDSDTNSAASRAIQVSDVSMISKHCSAGSNSPQGKQ